MPKKTKSDLVVEELRRAILKGEFDPGEWLRQDSLAERFGISHIPVREALTRLEAEGLVERTPHRGARIVTYNSNVVQEYYALRGLLEPYAVELAYARISAADLDELRTLVEQAETLLETDKLGELTQVNWEFHEKLVELCGSRLVRHVVDRVRRSFQLDTLLMIPERAAASVQEHREIYRALLLGDQERASHLMRQNIENAREAMLSRLPALAGGRE